MLVIIGHGPSIIGKGLGSWIDEQTVVRLKSCAIPDQNDWGSRTDFRCGYSKDYEPGIGPFWWFGRPGQNCKVADKWRDYYRKYSKQKISSGMAAIFCAVEFLKPAEIGLAGFDNLCHPEVKGFTKWTVPRHASTYRHDAQAEHDCAKSLVKIIDVTEPAWLTSSTMTRSRVSELTTNTTS